MNFWASMSSLVWGKVGNKYAVVVCITLNSSAENKITNIETTYIQVQDNID